MTRRLALLLLLAPVALARPAAADFTARLHMVEGGQTVEGEIYVSGPRHRLDLSQAGRDLVVLADREAGTTLLLAPAVRAYCALQSDDPLLLMVDPFQSALHAYPGAVSKVIETDEVSGQTCNVVQVSVEDKVVLTRWDSQELGFPLRVELPDGSRSVTLTQIEPGPVPPQAFAMPKGFRQLSFDELGELLWDASAEQPAPASPAVQRRTLGQYMTPGYELILRCGAGTEIGVTCREGADPGFQWSAVPQREGAALRPAAACQRQGAGEVTVEPGAGADAIALTDLQGEGSLNVELIGEQPLLGRIETYTLGARSSKGRSINEPYASLTVTVTGDREEGDAGGTTQGDIQISADDETTAQEYGRVHLELADGETWTRTFTPEQKVTSLDFTVQVGHLRVRVEQVNRAVD